MGGKSNVGHDHDNRYYTEAEVDALLAGVEVAPVATLTHETASGVGGGTFSSGAWQTRPINTEDDPNGVITLSGNEFTVSEDLRIEGWSSAYTVRTNQARLYNVTDGVAVAYGSSERSQTTTNQSRLTGMCEAGKTYRIEHRCDTSGSTTGFGRNTAWGSENLYAEFKFWRV